MAKTDLKFETPKCNSITNMEAITMKRNSLLGKSSVLIAGSLAVLALIYLSSSGPAHAQLVGQEGWLEGTVHLEDGAPDNYNEVVLFLDGKHVVTARTNASMSGLYEFRNIRPGVYEVRLGARTGHKSLRYWGVVVNPSVRSKLNIVIPKGDGIQEIGKPNVVTQKAIIIGDELARLQKEIDALKR